MTRLVLALSVAAAILPGAQKEHEHPVPERLGTVVFPISCKAEVQPEFRRAVALLHSFTYRAADEAFHHVAEQDPGCAIAHWGSAMTHYHQLWDLPPSAADTAAAVEELGRADGLAPGSERERGYLQAVGLVFENAATVPYRTRALRYEEAMHRLALANPNDAETQIFYALALISNASPADLEHRRQKQAAEVLEPLFLAYPDHPGVPHYLIHAYDNQELAARGLHAARVYAGIAPSAPHALHMPSHIFTRLGLWDDSIASNLAARDAARQQHDTGEELHAMDYLMYAYLQRGRDGEAAETLQRLRAMPALNLAEFKVGYAATAMPVRYVVERGQWKEAETIGDPPAMAQPQVAAITVWARGLGLARDGHPRDADREAAVLGQLGDRLRASGNSYWATQVDIMRCEVAGWSAQAAQRPKEAVADLRSAADAEDGMEKLPVTPGPILPAREQLGELLLEQGRIDEAGEAFRVSAANAPGRRRGWEEAARAAKLARTS